MAVKDFNAATLAKQVHEKLLPFATAVSDLQKWAEQISGDTPVKTSISSGALNSAHTIDDIKAGELDSGAKNGSEIIGSVEHVDANHDIYRSALCIMFDKAVKGHAADDQIHYKKRTNDSEHDKITYFGPRKEVEGSYYERDETKTEDVSTYARLWVMAEYDLGSPGRGVTFTVRPYRGPHGNYGMAIHNLDNHMPDKGVFSYKPETWWEHYSLPLLNSGTGFRSETFTSADGSLPQEIQDDLITLYKTGAQRGLFAIPGEGPAPKP